MSRPGWGKVAARALVSGSAGSLASALALAVAARAEGTAPLRPLNATSHWLHGERAAARDGADLAHTGTGYLTHHAACLFWAAAFEAWEDVHPARDGAALARDALALAAIAAAVDYGATPRRFTPGWEFALSKRGMAFAHLAMAAGIAAGSRLAPGREVPNNRA